MEQFVVGQEIFLDRKNEPKQKIVIKKLFPITIRNNRKNRMVEYERWVYDIHANEWHHNEATREWLIKPNGDVFIDLV